MVGPPWFWFSVELLKSSVDNKAARFELTLLILSVLDLVSWDGATRCDHGLEEGGGAGIQFGVDSD